MAIDFGQVTTGLSAVLGAGMGVTDQKILDRAVAKVMRVSGEQFAKYTDTVGESEVPHVYEYKSAWTGQEVNASPAGRLWTMRQTKIPGGMSLYIDLSKRSTIFAGPDPRLLAVAPQMASHRFPTKASHLESTQHLSATPGIQRFTKRSKEPSSPGGPRVLVYLKDGQVRFSSRTVRWENKFYGRFEQHFREYWHTTMTAKSVKNMAGFTRKMQPVVGGSIVSPVAAIRLSTIPVRALPGRITLLDTGRMYTGLRMKQGVVRSVKAKVGKRMERELVRAWLR